MKNLKKIKKWQFYLLSFTWGLPMSIIGCLVFLVLRIWGFKPKKYGHAYYIEIGKGWGGLELGWLFLTGVNGRESTKQHELGHAYQNACMLGWFMPIFSIISAVRYWLDRFGVKIDYYGWWFESQASKIGKDVMSR